MVEEKEKKKEEEVVVEAEEQVADGSDEETPKKAAWFAWLSFGKLKKYIIPASAALGAFGICAAIYIFVLSDRFEKDAATPSPDITGTHVIDFEKTGHEADRAESAGDIEALEIDTAEIMKELDFLFATPDMDGLGLTPEDSVDTLNWLQKEMARLAGEKALVEQRRKELEELEGRMNKGLIKIQQAESERIVKLARLYNGMKANEVAKVFANLDDDVIVDILPRMKSANAAKILGVLPPKRAAKISTQMITVLED